VRLSILRQVESLPDLDRLTDDELDDLIGALQRRANEKPEGQGDEVSFQRRLLHGRLDILRAERAARAKKNPREEEG
jgi:hypothetical protein